MKALYEEHSSKTFIYYTYLHLTQHLLISRMVISKEDALFKTRPKPKVNVQLRVYIQSLVGLRLLLVVCLVN